MVCTLAHLWPEVLGHIRCGLHSLLANLCQSSNPEATYPVHFIRRRVHMERVLLCIGALLVSNHYSDMYYMYIFISSGSGPI